jgi:ATP-dependent helicase/nuclease subunit B
MLLPKAVEFLARGWPGLGPLDLSRLLVVVPTQQAGRRLREALAVHAAQRGQAVFPPQVRLPDSLIAPVAGAATASRLESLLAWSEVLRAADLSAFRTVFPVDPPARTLGWSLALAESFLRVQSALMQAGLRLGDVAVRAGSDFPEADRWRELGALERAYDARLREFGKSDLAAARIAGAAAASLPPGVERIVVLASPDPAPLALAVLAEHARTLPVDVAIFAPAAEADAFDAWGRPVPARWAERVWSPPDFFERVHLCANPEAQAERISDLARSYESPEGALGVGVADAEILPWLETALDRAGLAGFNPEGRPLRREGLHALLSALAALARGADFDTVEVLGRCPEFIDYLQDRIGGGFSPSAWLEGLDDLRAGHLPADLAAAQEHAGEPDGAPMLVPALAAVAELRSILAAGPFAASAAAALGSIFAGRRLDPGRPADARFESAAAAWMDLVRECAAVAGALAPAEAWELALRLFGEARRTEDKPAGALELQGWLELLWEDAPHLAIAGVNDGSLPEAVAGDAFLPEPLCERLGLKTNAARFARDGYQLEALAACRRSGGRLDLLVGRTSAAGDPRRPSRLLLRCSDAELPARVEALFRAVPEARVAPAWQRAWRLKPPRVAPPPRLGVTSLGDYLACPFRFYLKHALRLSTVDPAKAELDVFDFGHLCHAALEAMGRDPGLRDCTDVPALQRFLAAALEREVRARYGRALTLPLLIQVESARQRLAKAAEVQAAQRSEGWVIVQTEERMALRLGALDITGRIDRVERHAGTGQMRVLDYKTSDRAVTPAEAHHRRARGAEETAPDFARFILEGKERVWTNLQLPLYLEAMAARAEGPLLAGYFNLPKAVGETAVLTWDGYDEDLRAAARRCAEGIAAAVAAGIFWPPTEPPDGGRREDPLFAGYFHHGTQESIHPDFAAAETAR